MTYNGHKVIKKVKSKCGKFFTLYFSDGSSLFIHKDELK